MNGNIGVESNLGKGSMFWFSIEVKRTDTNYLDIKENQKEKVIFFNLDSTKKYNILLVEDNEINRKVVLAIFKKYPNISIEEAFDGLMAIEKLKTKNYDLVFMDMQMPKMDGITSTLIIRDSSSQVKNHDIPIVAMTANVMENDREKCLKAGMNDFLTKPVTRKPIETALSKWLLP